MTTYTLQRADTGEHLSAYQVRQEVDRLDSIAEQAPVTGWTPNDPLARDRCGCGEYHESALIAPSRDALAAEGSTIAAELVRGIDRKPGWPTWLGDAHHAEAEYRRTISKLRSWADQYAARPIDRTIVQLVEVDTSYQQTDAALYAEMVVSQSRQSVYGELAPEALDAEQGPPHRLPPPPPPADRSGLEALARRDKERRQREQRAIAPTPAPEPEPEPVRTSWRTWAASIALGLTPALGLIAFAWWVA